MAKTLPVVISCHHEEETSPRWIAERSRTSRATSSARSPSAKESLPKPLTKREKEQRLEQARKLHEKDWLAPAGSVQERQFLQRWAKQTDSQEQRDLIYKWIKNPDQFAEWMKDPDKFGKRNAMFWPVAKKSVLGPVVYETAMERHGKLNNKEWLVACFTAQGMKQEEIGKLIDMSESTVDNVIAVLKRRITQELGEFVAVFVAARFSSLSL
jgi:ATP/maltotriose-dependent transcriptional regulator MalT